MADRQVDLDLIARDRASDAFDKASRSASGFGKTLKGPLSSAISDIGKTAAGVFTGLLSAQAFSGAVSFAKSTIDAARESAKVAAQTEAVLKSTGGAAGVTAKQIDSLATSLSLKTGIDDENIQSTENLLLTFTNLQNKVGKGNDIFNQATSIALDMSKALGQDTKSSAIQLGKALNDPIAGITALQRVGVSFSQQQKDQIKTLVEHGRTLDAQKLILAELTKEFGGSAAAQATSAQKLGVAMDNIKEQIGGALIPVIDHLSEWFSARLPGAIAVSEKIIGRAADLFRTLLFNIRFPDAIDEASGFGHVIAVIGQNLGRAINWVTSFGNALREGFSNRGALDGAVGIWKRIEQIGGVMHTVVDFVRQHWQPILIAAGVTLGLLTAPITTVAVVLTVLYNRFEPIRAVMEKVVGFVEANAVPVLAGLAAVVLNFLVPAFIGWAAGAISAAVATIAAALPVIALVAALGLVVGAVVYAYQHFAVFRTVVNDVFAVVKAVVLGAIAVIAALPGVVSHVVGAVIGFFEAIPRVIGGAIGAIVRFFEALPGQILGALAALPGLLLDLAGQAIGLMIVGLLTAVVGLYKFWTDLVPWVLGKIVELAAGLLTAGGQALASLLTGIVNAVPALLAFIGGLPGQIVNGLAALGGLLLAAGGAALSGLLTGITQGVPALLGFIGGLPGQILSGLGDIGSTLFHAGADLLSGFINGIKSMAGRLIDAIKSTITDHLPGFVKSALGISSPSKVFHKLGAAVAAGFANGIEAGGARIDAAMRFGPYLDFGRTGPAVLAGASIGGTSAPAGAGSVIDQRQYHFNGVVGDQRQVGLYLTDLLRRLSRE